MLAGSPSLQPWGVERTVFLLYIRVAICFVNSSAIFKVQNLSSWFWFEYRSYPSLGPAPCRRGHRHISPSAFLHKSYPQFENRSKSFLWYGGSASIQCSLGNPRLFLLNLVMPPEAVSAGIPVFDKVSCIHLTGRLDTAWSFNGCVACARIFPSSAGFWARKALMSDLPFLILHGPKDRVKFAILSSFTSPS